MSTQPHIQDSPTTPGDKKPSEMTVTVSKGKRKAPSAFRTISEVADELDVQQHVLRFWETKFTQVKPLKRGGGRRYYRPEDVSLLRRIHHLLYTEGYTIKGVQKLMKGQGRQQIISNDTAGQPPVAQASQAAPVLETVPVTASMETTAMESQPAEKVFSEKQKLILKAMLGELKDLRDMIRGG